MNWPAPSLRPPNPRADRRAAFFHRTLALLCLIAVGGCFARDHAEEDDHLEHHVPAHRPATFASGVQEVSARWSQLAEKWPGLPADAAEPQLHELQDILSWLPELAAETDLPEEPWNRLRAISQQLATQLPAPPTAGAGSRGVFPTAESVSQAMAELRAFAEQAEKLAAESFLQ